MISRLLRSVSFRARRQYVAAMLMLMGHALAAISRTDLRARQEVAGLPPDFVFEMTVPPAGPSLQIRHIKDGELIFLNKNTRVEQPDLSVRFKHIAHAFLVLSFQEKTAVAFARDRMLVDGDISYAVRLTRVIDRLEAFILPRFLASRAVKEYPAGLRLREKLTGALQIYRRVVLSLIKELSPL